MKPNLHVIEATAQKTLHCRQLNRLADALVYALNIDSGQTLVPFLAPLHARDNREAVCCWLEAELSQPDVELSRHCIEVLLPRLEKKLYAIQEVLQ